MNLTVNSNLDKSVAYWEQLKFSAANFLSISVAAKQFLDYPGKFPGMNKSNWLSLVSHKRPCVIIDTKVIVDFWFIWTAISRILYTVHSTG